MGAKVLRARGVVILYATIAIGMLGVLGISMTDGSQATLDAVQSSTYAQLARYAAESGIEYAISSMDSQMVQPCPEFRRNAGPPVTFSLLNDGLNPACDFGFLPCSSGNAPMVGWADPAGSGDAELTCPSGGLPKVAQLNMAPNGWGTPSPVLVGGAEAELERMAARYALSFRISCNPRFDGVNVGGRLQPQSDVQAVFHIRSRGMVRGGLDPNNPADPLLLGHCTLVCKVRIGTSACSTGAGGKARVQRICMDILNTTNNDRPQGGTPPEAARDFDTRFPTVSQPH